MPFLCKRLESGWFSQDTNATRDVRFGSPPNLTLHGAGFPNYATVAGDIRSHKEASEVPDLPKYERHEKVQVTESERDTLSGSSGEEMN